eukprot:9711414-Ditylum_brightwellii.AAC.1
MLIGRIKWSTIQILANPTEFLTPDFDIQMAIYAMIAELGMPYDCNHAQGHQDRKKPPQN